MKYIAGDNTALMDLSAFDDTDETVLMWHCGPASSRFGKKYQLGANYTGMPHVKGEPPVGCGVVRDMVFDEMPVTVFRLTGECDKYMLMSGRFIGSEKKSFTGSRGWLGDVRRTASLSAYWIWLIRCRSMASSITIPWCRAASKARLRSLPPGWACVHWKRCPTPTICR